MHFADFLSVLLKAYHCVETGCYSRQGENIHGNRTFRGTFVCLANSRKNCGKCVAGLKWIDEKVSNQWFRPVLDREGKAIQAVEMICQDKLAPKLLDIVRVPVIEHKPYLYQTENWLFTRAPRWEKVGRIDWSDLDSLADSKGVLWKNMGDKNDWVDDKTAVGFSHSLRLVKVEGVKISVGPARFRRPVRARFQFDNNEYDLKVTDPVVEEWARNSGIPSMELPGKRYLTISFAGPFSDDSLHYKLVAAIMKPPA